MVSRETNPLLALSAQQATWLFFRMLEDLKQEALETLRLRLASPQVEAAYQLVTTFLLMVASVICISVMILWRFRHKGWL
jgi:hypothetical protein